MDAETITKMEDEHVGAMLCALIASNVIDLNEEDDEKRLVLLD